jgi:alpha-beta hydrolase superfamily lysophospholipase
MRNLFYHWEGLYQYAMLGYAVIATDYAGLGTGGRHAYLDMASNATDVVYSVPAGRAAVASLGEKWIAIGHSQGGLSTLGVAQLEYERRDPGYLGAVVLAGASDLVDGIDAMLSVDQPLFNGLLAFVVFGAKTVYPALELQTVLTDASFARYTTFVEDGCSAAYGAFTALAPTEMLAPGWKEDRYMQQFLARQRPGEQPARGPLLLVTGGADPLFTESAARNVRGRLCARGERVQWNVYPGFGHDAVVYSSLRDQLDWISARFSGAPGPSNCP